MKKAIALLVLTVALCGWGYSQVAVTAPAARDELKACADYADDVLHDRWDMNQRTDLAWRIFNTVEQPYSYLKNISFQNGIFTATSVYCVCPFNPDLTDFSFANIMILDSAYPGSVTIGKYGSNFPINADQYTTIAIRMYLGAGSAGLNGRLLWSKNTIYGGLTTSKHFQVHDGWYIYLINIPNLGVSAGYDFAGAWEDAIDSLRLDPLISCEKTIKIDWIRLVEPISASQRTISWSGISSGVDIYLDNDNDPGNGTLGYLAKNVSGTNYTFLAGALAPGDYYTAVAPAGTSSLSYSPGYYHINDNPIIRVTKPSDEGSDTDFITANFSDPWDMSNAADVEHAVNVNNARFTALTYEDLAGNSFTNRTVYYGESQTVPGLVGDPETFFLHFLYRGASSPIDTTRYHNLVIKMGIAGTHSTNDGSVGRVMWRRTDETAENVSKAFIVHHLGDRWIMHDFVIDMNTLPIEPYPGSPSQSGWTGLVDSFRIDPHEFPTARAFFFDEVRLTADWTARDSFSIDWELEDSDGSPAVSLYYDNNDSGYDGTKIVRLSSCRPPGGSYTWDTSGIPDGTYWIYAVADDGVNVHASYGGGPVKVSHALVPEISLSRSDVYLGAERQGPAGPAAEVLITNSGEGTLNWEAVADQNWVTVSPGSGTGDGVISIGLAHTIFPRGSYTAKVQVRDSNATNSPRIINVHLTVYESGCAASPFGSFDTPINGSTVSGNIPVTGWVLDGIGVERVEIKREPTASDPPGVIGGDGLIYIGLASFVKGARPDIEDLYPTYPSNEQAGWGYMMLTNFLPNGGNGSFVLHAVAANVSGRVIDLGAKTIHCDNAGRTLPFGTLDTPGQGETISGDAYMNFGWALTPLPKKIPEDGSTIQVMIDSVPVGHPVYNQYREDIAGLFPDYANSQGAVGLFALDTTQFANGIHTIAWGVTDDAGAADGIGSRYIEIQNLDGVSAASAGTAGAASAFPVDTGGWLAVSISLPEEEGQLLSRAPRRWGDAEYYAVEELEKLEIQLSGNPGARYLGWGRDDSRGLPIGSTLNPESGLFSWMPGPGFLGRHVLHFAVTDGKQRSMPIRVVVDIRPQGRGSGEKVFPRTR